MKEIKVDKISFYNMLELIFNAIYEFNYVVRDKKNYNFSKMEKYFSGEVEEYFLLTKDNRNILNNMQIKKAVKYNEMISNREGNSFDTSFITISEINDLVKENAIEYNFLIKIPAIIVGLNNDENIKDGKIFISEELALLICRSFKKYVDKENFAERCFENEIFNNTFNASTFIKNKSRKRE